MRAEIGGEVAIDSLGVGPPILRRDPHVIYKLQLSPGYRVYFARDRLVVVLLLCGGDKRTQAKDIKRAKEYLHDYKRRTAT